MPRYLANQDLDGALLDLRRGLTSLSKSVGQAKELGRGRGSCTPDG